ncbi:Protein of unknown function [Halovenus aranensis]|jgi:hypothetical protein|uniref:DUF3054 domain-containing protein n=1 Tax=Halovenus aranensis TaxID=890420 RepID=A0A1G8RTX4_9EURY|nr:DUF3054 domain-containing protein [Halovenus aranensis]SDJ20412.1 Protein of unknown function [Halovenus aranensis]
MLRHVRTLGVRPSLPASPAAALVLLGDLLGLLLFIAWGLYAHNLRAWEVPVHTAETLAPFLIAWLVFAPLLGLYQGRTLRSYGQTLALLVPGWAGIALVGALIRATSLFSGGASPVFVVVNVVFGLLVLAPWRLAVVAGFRRLGL